MMQGRNHDSDAVADRIRPGSVGVEIGVWAGDTSAKFLKKASHLHLVDPWSVDPYKAGAEYGGFQKFRERYAQMVGSVEPKAFDDYYEDTYQKVRRRFAGKPVTIHRMTSAAFFDWWATGCSNGVDWVYIDGLHSYEACMGDLRGAFKILKQGGVIYGDDYGHPKSHRLGPVGTAVDDFAKEIGRRVIRIGEHQFELAL